MEDIQIQLLEITDHVPMIASYFNDDLPDVFSRPQILNSFCCLIEPELPIDDILEAKSGCGDEPNHVLKVMARANINATI